MVKPTPSRSGFVYAASHPDHPHWIKWGFTRRAPFRRLSELSGVSVRSSFSLLDARFVWDAISTERLIHQYLESKNIPRQKEFFEMNHEAVASVMDWAEQHDAQKRPCGNSLAEEDDFSDMQHQCIEWLHGDLSANLKKIQGPALRQLEKYSAQGHEASSIILAEHHINQYLAEHAFGLPQWRHAHCLYMAAVKQGRPEAAFRSLFWKSLLDPSCMEDYWNQVWVWRERIIEQTGVPELVDKTFEQEQQLWKTIPQRAQAWAQWCSSASAPSRPSP